MNTSLGGTINLIGNEDDLKKMLQTFVLGHCVLWNQHAKQFSNELDLEFFGFVNRTVQVCLDYLYGKRNLDGRCSDFECVVGLEVKKLFQVHVINMLEHKLESLIEHKNLDVAGEVRAQLQRTRSR